MSSMPALHAILLSTLFVGLGACAIDGEDSDCSDAACSAGEAPPLETESLFGRRCGDQICSAPFETKYTCAADCGGVSAVCGDDLCSQPAEGPYDCPADCGYLSPCGDGFCGAPGEVCEQDCAPFYSCGNNVCEEPFENLASCTGDCRECICGDGFCIPGDYPSCGETPETCPFDCYCGDGVCAGEETIVSCRADCAVYGFCGDDYCDYGEPCPADCAQPCDCGDGICDVGCNELQACNSFDCSYCGDGECRVYEQGSCPQDCD